MLGAAIAYFVIPDVPGWVGLGVLALAVAAAVHVLVMPRVRFRVHRWEVTSTAVHTREGWIGRESRIAPISRVQTVDSRQGALMRMFGLASHHGDHRLRRRTHHHLLPRRPHRARRRGPADRDHRRDRGRRHVIPIPRRRVVAAQPAQAAARPGQGAAAGTRARLHRPDRREPQRHAVLVARPSPGDRRPGRAGRHPLAHHPLPPDRQPDPGPAGPAQQEHLHCAARPGPQRRPRGVPAAPHPRPAEGPDRHRSRRRPHRARRPGHRRCPGTAYDVAATPCGDRATGRRGRRGRGAARHGAGSNPPPSCWPASTGRGCASRRSA